MLDQHPEDSKACDGNHGLVEGALVLTLRGTLPVEALVPGDRIVTRSGALRLAAVEVRTEPRARLVRVAASALGHDRPETDITLAADQPILLRDWRARALAGTDQALMPAARLADGEYVRVIAPQEARLYRLHFDMPAVIYAQGLELECEPARVTA